MIKDFEEIFLRELNKLRTELTLYKDEKNLWITQNQVSNTAGNLFLHLTGNVNHFIGAQLGNTGYVREREKEFSEKNVAREEMIGQLDETIEMAKKVFGQLSDADLSKQFPLNTFGENRTVHFVLIQLTAHLEYHLGQINYLRRLTES